MNDYRPLPSEETGTFEASTRPMDGSIGEAGTGSACGSGTLLTGTGSALTDKEAVRIAIRQLSLEELRHEEAVIGKQLAMLHGVLAEIRRERKYRRSLHD